MFDLGKRFLIALTAAERKYQYDYSDLHGTFLTGTLDDEARHALSYTFLTRYWPIKHCLIGCNNFTFYSVRNYLSQVVAVMFLLRCFIDLPLSEFKRLFSFTMDLESYRERSRQPDRREREKRGEDRPRLYCFLPCNASSSCPCCCS